MGSVLCGQKTLPTVYLRWSKNANFGKFQTPVPSVGFEFLGWFGPLVGVQTLMDPFEFYCARVPRGAPGPSRDTGTALVSIVSVSKSKKTSVILYSRHRAGFNNPQSRGRDFCETIRNDADDRSAFHGATLSVYHVDIDEIR